MDSSQPPPPPPPPPERCSLSTRIVLPALVATVALAAIILAGFDPAPASAQSPPTHYNLATRTTQVCAELLEVLQGTPNEGESTTPSTTATQAIYNATNGTYPWSDSARTTLVSGASAPASGTYTAPVGLGCTGAGKSVWVPAATLNSLQLYAWPFRLRLGHKGINSLQSGDFAGLSLLGQLELFNNNLTSLPANLFSGTKVYSVNLKSNKLTTLPADMFNGRSDLTSSDPGRTDFSMRASFLNLDNNPINDMPDNVFDSWTTLRKLSMQNTRIGVLNTRWFERLAQLGRTYQEADGDAWYSKSTIRFDNMPVMKYHHKVGSTVTANSEVEYHGDGDALATAMKARIAAYATATAGVTDTSVIGAGTVAQMTHQLGKASNFTAEQLATNFVAPSIGLDTCAGRSDPVAGEILTTMRSAPNDGLGNGWDHEVGDIYDARWSKSLLGCTSVLAEYVTIETGAPFTGAYSATTHEGPNATVAKSFKKSHEWHTLNFEDADITDDNGALKPDDFKNLFNVSYLRLHHVKIKDIPPDTFKHMPNLKELRILNGQLDNDDLNGPNSFLKHFRNLKTLWIYGNNLTEFDASEHLPANVRATLTTLLIPSNPIKTTDLEGLDLVDLRIQGTRITTLDPAIHDMENLISFWWRSSFLTNEGIDPNSDPAAYFAEFPSTLRISQHTEQLGNPFLSDDPVIQASAVQTQLDHAARMQELNVAGGGSHVIDRFLGDPCRADIYSFKSFQAWSDSGDLCLTGAQISDWVASLDSFGGLNNVRSLNLDLSDAQTGALIDNVEGKPLTLFSIRGAEDAFGAGFDDSKLDAFSTFGALSRLFIMGTAITHPQAKLILDKLGDKFLADGSATNHAGLYHLNLSYNPNLFAGATAASVAGFLDNVSITGANKWSDFWLQIRDTGLTFPVLVALVDSMDNDLQLRAFDVSQNPGLWTHAEATDDAITALFTRLKGANYVNVGDTGMTAAQARLMFDALGSNGGTPVGGDGGNGIAEVKHTLARLSVFAIGGIDLSDPALVLDDDYFAQFGGRYATSQGVLQTLTLSDTNIDFDGFKEIIDGLSDADELQESLRTLILDESGELWKSIDPTDQAQLDELTEYFAKLKNLRTLTIRSASLPADSTATPPTSASHFTQAHLNAIMEGLDQADGDTDGEVGNMYLIDVSGNPELFAPLENAQGEVTETAAQQAARLAPVFAKASHALLRIQGTGLTQAQLTGIITANADLTDQLVEGGTIPMTSTPPPKSAMIESGRRSIQIVFTHEPRSLIEGGANITATGYEYRYRKVPSDPTAPWTELWRTLTLDLALGTASSKDFSFNIHGLEPEAAYQVQIRATGGTALTGNTAASSVVLVRGGTILDLPQINSISPDVTEVSVRAGDTVRLSVNVFDLQGGEDNGIVNAADSDLIFRWSETSTATGGSFGDPNHERRVIYTAPGLPGTYTVMAEAQPDGVCRKHHTSEFGITDADRADCQATVTVHVSRAPDTPEAAPVPINPPDLIPTSLTDNDGTAYAVFLPVEGGTFSGEGITVSAQPGAVPDRTLVGVAAATAGAVPDPTPGARMTLAGMFFDIMGIDRDGATPVTGYAFDDPISACLPLPTVFRGNVSDVVLVEQKSDGSIGVLATKIRQTSGALSVCGSLTNLPATVAVAKLGTVPPPPPETDPGPGDELPDTGATTPYGAPWSIWALLIGAALLLATTTAITRGRRTAGRTN